MDHPYDGFGSPDLRYAMDLETFAVEEGVYIWRGYLPLYMVEVAMEVSSPFLAVALDGAMRPSPCEGPPLVPDFDVCRLHDGMTNLSGTLHP